MKAAGARFTVIESLNPPPSLAGVRPPTEEPLRIGVVQHAWEPDPAQLEAKLDEGIAAAAARGAKIVFLPEVTLIRYLADTVPDGEVGALAEDLDDGPSLRFARSAAAHHDVHVHISVFRRTEHAPGGRGRNTALIVAPDGEVVAINDKLHIPVTAGYYEDRYFLPGPAQGGHELGNPYPVFQPAGLGGVRIGLPTCWDSWFPEVARAYSLGGADIVVYPTAIGSEPDHPGFDTRPLWQQVIVGNGISNALFMVVPNRTGAEIKADGSPGNTFYGSSFVSDPYGRILAQAPRDAEAVLVVDLALEQRRDWLDLFPFLATRRPDTYATLVAPVDHDQPYGAPAPRLTPT